MIIKIKNGNIINKEEYFKFMTTIKDGEYILKKYRHTRSMSQNNYYWALLDIVEQETGIDKDETHEKMKMKFLYVQPPNKYQLGYCKSTSKLDSTEFGEYIENIKNFMAQFGIVLPNADEFENYVLTSYDDKDEG